MAPFASFVDRLFEICDLAVSGGYLVAMVLVCLLQYVYHLYQSGRSAELKEQLCRQIDETQQDLRCVSRDRTLTSLENQIIRDFAKELNLDRTLDQLLSRLVSESGDGFAAYIPLGDQPWRVSRCRGLSEKSRESLVLDPALVEKMARESVLPLAPQEISQSELYKSLSQFDRSRCGRLFLAAVGESERLAGVIVTTSLIPAGIPLDQQIDLMRRLMQSLTGIVLRAHELETRDRQLRSINETMELRGVMDQKHTSPLEMIEAYVDRLREMSQAERAVLFLVTKEKNSFKPLCRCGRALSSPLAKKHADYEVVLAETASAGKEFESLTAAELGRLGVSSLIGSAIVAPVMSPTGVAGVLCLTRSSREPFRDIRPELINWATSYLSETLLRALHQAVDQWHARQDSLTTLSNRRTFDQELANVLSSSQASSALLMVDVDRFKSINDRFGHLGGDEVLRSISRRLKDAVAQRQSELPGLAARFGGEEFAILLPGAGLNEAFQLAETIRKGIESSPVMTQQGEIAVTASIGIALCPDQGRSAEDLVAAADAALYQAKNSGRNRTLAATGALASQ